MCIQPDPAAVDAAITERLGAPKLTYDVRPELVESHQWGTPLDGMEGKAWHGVYRWTLWRSETAQGLETKTLLTSGQMGTLEDAQAAAESAANLYASSWVEAFPTDRTHHASGTIR